MIAAFCCASAFGTTLVPVQLLNPTGSSSGQMIVSSGASTPPTWGNVALNGLAAQAANTVVANATASSASPTAVALPSCSGQNNALRWSAGSGFVCASSVALISQPLSQFASTTSAQLAAVISDETGTGSLVFGTNPTISGATQTGGTINNAVIGGTTAAAGTFTTLTATGAITPSQTAGIVGTTTNNNANAGSVGEYISTTGTATSLTNSTYVDLATQSLTAGDWDVECSVQFNGTSLVASAFAVGVNTIANTNPNSPGTGQSILGSNFTGGSLTSPLVRESLSSTTTLRCGGQANFSGGSVTGTGMIRARRVR